MSELVDDACRKMQSAIIDTYRRLFDERNELLGVLDGVLPHSAACIAWMNPPAGSVQRLARSALNASLAKLPKIR